MEIVLNESTWELTVGEYKKDVTQIHLNPKMTICSQLDLLYRVSFANKVNVDTFKLHGLGIDTSMKEFSQAFSKSFKITPSMFIKVVRDLQYKALVAGITEKCLWGCYGMGGPKRKLKIPKSFLQTKPLLIQCIKDGQENITPLVAKLGKTPQELRKEFGKGIWKALCKNSLTRNRLIAQNMTSLVDSIKTLYDLPSSGIKQWRGCGAIDDLYIITIKLAKKARCLTNKSKFSDINNVVRDTSRLAARANAGDINPKWSLTRFKKEHEELTQKVNVLHYSKEKIFKESYSVLPKKVELESVNGTLTATLLTTPSEIAEEGVKMRHCVAGYSSLCEQGKYAVYHIEGEYGYSSTLGLRSYVPTHPKANPNLYREDLNIVTVNIKIPKLSWESGQHYSECNSNPSPSCCIVAEEVRRVIKENLVEFNK